MKKILSVINDFAVLDNGVTCQNTKNCLGGNGLTGTGLANDGESLAPFQIKGDITDGFQRTIGGTEGDPQVFYFKNLIHLSFLHTAQRGVERIAQTVTEQVKAKHQ